MKNYDIIVESVSFGLMFLWNIVNLYVLKGFFVYYTKNNRTELVKAFYDYILLLILTLSFIIMRFYSQFIFLFIFSYVITIYSVVYTLMDVDSLDERFIDDIIDLRM